MDIILNLYDTLMSLYLLMEFVSERLHTLWLSHLLMTARHGGDNHTSHNLAVTLNIDSQSDGAPCTGDRLINHQIVYPLPRH